jgi:hypothetical protein
LNRAAGSVGLALGLTAWDAGVAPYAAVPAGFGVLGLVGALASGRPRLIGPSAVLLGLGYGLTTIGAPVTGSAVLYGIGLLAVTELASWSVELRSGAGPLPGGERRRWIVLAWVGAVSAAVAGVVLVAGTAASGGGAGEVAAAAGCVGVVGLLTRIARFSPG